LDLQKAKPKTEFVCQQCGARSSKWIGRCPSCGEWNTYTEEIIPVTGTRSPQSRPGGTSLQPLSEVKSTRRERLRTGLSEFDRLLGGGLVAGSMVLIGGEPGIGKSTLALQIALLLRDQKILYLSGEESRTDTDPGRAHRQCA
jgi:DNA repair protein RadA/Sms